MSPERYSINNGKDWTTIRSCVGPVGVAVAAYNLQRPIFWESVTDCDPWAKHVVINDSIHVYQHV